MTMDSGVVALAFTLDGSFIAGADHQGVKIWKTEEVNMEYAKWRRGDDAGWRTPQSSDSSSTADEDHFSLCWNAGGNKIAYGVNNRVGTYPVQIGFSKLIFCSLLLLIFDDHVCRKLLKYPNSCRSSEDYRHICLDIYRRHTGSNINLHRIEDGFVDHPCGDVCVRVV